MIVIDIISDNPNHKFVPYQRMANVIIDLTRKNGWCLPQDLCAVGFTNEETKERWHMAQAMASVELKLINDTSSSNNISEEQYV